MRGVGARAPSLKLRLSSFSEVSVSPFTSVFLSNGRKSMNGSTRFWQTHTDQNPKPSCYAKCESGGGPLPPQRLIKTMDALSMPTQNGPTQKLGPTKKST